MFGHARTGVDRTRANISDVCYFSDSLYKHTWLCVVPLMPNVASATDVSRCTISVYICMKHVLICISCCCNTTVVVLLVVECDFCWQWVDQRDEYLHSDLLYDIHIAHISYSRTAVHCISNFVLRGTEREFVSNVMVVIAKKQ